MVIRAESASWGVAGRRRGPDIPDETELDIGSALIDEADQDEGSRLSLGKLLLAAFAWLGLLIAIAGVRLLSPTFWLSQDGIALLAETGLPVAVAVLLYAVWDRLNDLGQQNDEIRAALARFSEPEQASGGNIISIRHAVHKELAVFNEHLDRSLDKTGEIETVIRREVETLERTFAENERRMLALVQELARQRETVVSATEQVRDVVKANRETLNVEFAGLASQIAEAGSHARGVVEQVNIDLRGELSARGLEFADALRRTVSEELQPINEALGTQVRSLDALLSAGDGGLVSLFGKQAETLSAELTSTWDRLSGELTGQAKLTGEMAGNVTRIVEQSLESNINRLESRIASASQEMLGIIENAAEAASQKIGEAGTASAVQLEGRISTLHEQVGTRLERLGGLIDSNAAGFIPALEKHNSTLERAMGLESAVMQSTAKFSSVLGEQATAFVATLSQSLQEFQSQLGDEASAIGDGLAGKLDRSIAMLENGSKRYETTLRSLEDSVNVAGDKLTIAMAAHNAEFVQRVEQIESLVSNGSDRIGEHLSKGTADLMFALDGGSQNVQAVLSNWTSRITNTLTVSLNSFDASTQGRLEAFQGIETTGRAKLHATLDTAVGTMTSLIEAGTQSLSTASASATQLMTDVTVRFRDDLSTLSDSFAATAEDFADTAKASLMEAGTAGLTALDDRITAATDSLQSRLAPFYSSLDTRTRELEADIIHFGSSIDTQTSRLHRLISQKSQAMEEGVERGVARLDTALAMHLQQSQNAMEGFVDEETKAFRQQMAVLTQTLADQSDKLRAGTDGVQALLTTRSNEFEAGIAEFGSRMESRTEELRALVGRQSQAIGETIDSGTISIRDSLESRSSQAEAMLRQLAQEAAANFDRQVGALALTLQSRSEVLDSILRTRGEDFTDRLYSSAKQFEEELSSAGRRIEETMQSGEAGLQERLAEQLTTLRGLFDAMLKQLHEGRNQQMADIDNRLLAASRQMSEILEHRSASVVGAMGERTAELEKALTAAVGGIGDAVRQESLRLTADLAENAAGFRDSLTTCTTGLEAQLRDRAAAMASTAVESSDMLGRAMEQAARTLEDSVRKDVVLVKSTMDKSLDNAARMMLSGAESTQQQVVSAVEKLLSRLSAHEKSATSRMEEAAASVGDSTRKAAEMTAGRLVGLNGALVQALNALGSPRPPTKPKMEVPNAAE
ncbi:MAG: hypothetical protein P4M09_08355 [Devosia sp.]|nr:hypothetical protein [Devosia sp.]